MKTTQNQSPKASIKLLDRAIACGIKAEVIEKSKPHSRRPSSLGSTASPQKVLLLNDIRMSLGQAEQYITAREV